MAYATAAQLADRLTGGILANMITEAGDDRDRVLTQYLDMASAVIDARLSSMYATPVASTPLLSLVCQNLAIWQIVADRGGFASDNVPAAVQKGYDQAHDWLGKLASGEMQLSKDAGKASGAAAGLSVSSPAPLFNPASPGMEYF